jgi:SAM-dependent methyltransferase
MPAEQGVVNWPSSGLSSSALVEISAMPLPDSCIDRALIVHALEIADHPHDLLSEIWRILTPGGRVIVVVPSRSGLWARLDRTPFGHGRPYSRANWANSCAKPFRRLIGRKRFIFRRFAPDVVARQALSSDRRSLSLPWGGVLIVEATKLLYRPVGARRSAYATRANLSLCPNPPAYLGGLPLNAASAVNRG